jgi:hypothetical protein
MLSNPREAAIQNAEASNLALHKLSTMNGGRRKKKLTRKSRKRRRLRNNSKKHKKRYGGAVAVDSLPHQSLNSSSSLAQANKLVTSIDAQAKSFAMFD